MDNDRIRENELRQMEEIRELDLEELQVEEADGESEEEEEEEEDEEFSSEYGGGDSSDGEFTFDTCLPSLHSYLGDVEDTRGRVSFLDGGAVLCLPMFYLEGVVLFPEATLPLRVIQPRYKASVEKAMRQDTSFIIGVVRVYQRRGDTRRYCSEVGTTAEIRQYRRLQDGSLNVVTRGQQRFRLRRMWVDSDRTPMAEVQIIEEDKPLRTPKDAFGSLASIGCSRSSQVNLCGGSHGTSSTTWLQPEEINDLDHIYDSVTESDDSIYDMESHYASADSSGDNGGNGADASEDNGSNREFTSSDDEPKLRSLGNRKRGTCKARSVRAVLLPDKPRVRAWAADDPKWSHRAPRAFWPHWVYRMYDAFSLARRAADMWKEIVGVSNLDVLTRKPDMLSFHIGSKMPISESTRQELLEIDGTSYRLRREIELLEHFDTVRCKSCLSVIAKRSDSLVMSRDGPLNAYANPHGYVHEVMTLNNACGLALAGSPQREHSWFPGYAWTIAYCATCGLTTNMGWFFTAIDRNLRPKAFWGIRSSQVADEIL
ncbi:hypothetical protein H6P81_009071 [Aristolochia fimbriata]|uniref:Protein cereblon n=1 Tax=Aristolochia fimbriata TaxID=158543 RepID=A0AAV7EL16_ARIFI|nr:hypothetical protein H6P81_009071 [Aristolochia fimbriata]